MNVVWQSEAACRGVDSSIFYPLSDAEEERAKAICGQCAVREGCLEYALGKREREGVWGGATERERRRILRRRQREQRKTA